jgi:hypothetical protein
VLPRRWWAFTATRWLPRSPLSSLPGRCRAFCYSHTPLIIQVTAMTSCFTTRHPTRVRSPSGADEGCVAKLATCERFATQDRRTCPPGFMINLSLAILPIGAERAVEDPRPPTQNRSDAASHDGAGQYADDSPERFHSPIIAEPDDPSLTPSGPASSQLHLTPPSCKDSPLPAWSSAWPDCWRSLRAQGCFTRMARV